MAKQIGVQVGQQYVKVHSTRKPPPIWEVNLIYPDVLGIAHAVAMSFPAICSAVRRLAKS